MSKAQPIQAKSSAPSEPFTPVSSTYDRASGRFAIIEHEGVDDQLVRDVYVCHGYAGRGRHTNAPGSSHLVGLGPLPAGEYRVGLPGEHPRLGPLVFRLSPRPGTMMFGRSGFYIHGDSKDGDASRGCIVLNRRHRQVIADLGVRSLTVI